MRFQTPMVFVDFGQPWYLPPERAVREMQRYPAGSRVMMLRFFLDDIARNPKDACLAPDGRGGWKRTTHPSPWMVNGIRECRARVQSYFDAFKRAGGLVDVVLFDVEESLSCWYLGKSSMEAICADPRFRTNVVLVSGEPQGAFNLSRSLGVDLRKVVYTNDSWSRWNAVMNGIFGCALHEAGFKPVRALFPKVIVSNYESAVLRQAEAIPNGAGEWMWRQSNGVGTHDSWQFYGAACEWQAALPAGPNATIGAGAYAQLRLGVIGIRGLLRSSSRPQMPWIAHRQFGFTQFWGPWTVPFAGTEYWDEQVRQFVMHGCDTLLVFNPEQGGMTGDPREYNPPEDQVVLDRILGEMNERLATATGPAVWYQKPEWSDRIMATGRQVRGGMLWRFSFAENVPGVIVTMRNGDVRTIVREAGSAGAWFFAESSNPISERSDRTGLAMAEATVEALRADLDGEGSINEGDCALLLLSMGDRGDLAEDLDGDGVVTNADIRVIQSVMQQARAARANRMPVVSAFGSNAVNVAMAGR